MSLTDQGRDQAWVDRINAGDTTAFAELYDHYSPWVYRLAQRFTSDAADAADVLQEVFLYFLGKFPGFELRARVTTFLYPVVRHEAITAGRKRGRNQDANELDLAAKGEDPVTDDLVQVLQVLPEAQREVLLLRFVDGLSEAEIADVLEIPPGTVKSRAHHAVKTLKDDPRTRAWFESF